MTFRAQGSFRVGAIAANSPSWSGSSVPMGLPDESWVGGSIIPPKTVQELSPLY